MMPTLDPKLKRKKEKEEKERLEEAFEEFRETFEETSGVKKIVKTFIRGDVVNANKSVPSSPAVYKPSPILLKSVVKPPPLETAKKKAEETAKKIMMEASDKNSQNLSPALQTPMPVPNVIVPPVSKSTKPGIKKVVEKPRLSNLETFKEELKQMQAMRDERKGLRQHLKERLNMPEEELDRIAPSLDQPYGPGGSDPYGEDDPNTTNLYVCNLPADAKLEDFFDTFATFGPLASARILYPRPEDERRYRETLSGFVAFMSRADAERAKCAMHQETIRNSELRVSWARPVNLPPLPFYVPLPLRELAMPDPPSGLPFNARPQTEELRSFLQKYGDLPKLGVPITGEESESDTQMLEDYKKMIENATVRVVIPTERPLLALIHRVVEFLVRSGPLFEAILMARERQNPMYRFLFDNHHPTHVYYRWRLYTVLQGDDRQKWRLEKFKMFARGSWWQSPPHSLFEQGMPPQLYDTAYVPKRRRDKPYEKREIAPRPRSRRRSGGASSEEEEGRRVERRRSRSEREREREKRRRDTRGILVEADRDQLEGMLRNLSPEKIAIGDAMVWCLDHAECAKEITQCVFESLCIKETPLHKKIARVYLVSDILANCAARIKDAFYFRQFFGDYLLKIFVELNETLEGIESRLKAEQFRQRVMLCFRNWEDNAVYPTDLLIQCQNVFLGLVKHGDDEAVETSSIDGEPLASEGGDEMDIDGEPMAEEGQEREQHFYGVPIGEEEHETAEDDIDGVPMDEAYSLMPKSDTAKMNVEIDNRFTVGSWNTVEIEVTSISADANVDGGGEAATGGSAADLKSKWEAIDLHSRWERHEGVAREFVQQQQRDDEDGEHSPTRKKHKLSRLSPDAEYSKPNGGTVAGYVSTDDEARRRILREIEVKVMKLQDQLEMEGELSQSEINAELAKCRQRLVAKLDEKSRNKERKRTSAEKEAGGRGGEREKRNESEKEKDKDKEGRGRRRESLNSHNRREEKERDSSREKRREWSREREKHRERDRSTERERDRERRRERDREETGRKSARSRSPADKRRR